jgi:hypothetical protein
MNNDLTTFDDTSMMKMIEKLSVNPDVDADKLQKLLDMNLKIMDRNAKDIFYRAMNTVQAQLPSFKKIDKAHANYFVKLERILEILNPILRDNNFSLSFSQQDSKKENVIKVKGILSHVAGHSESYFAELEIDAKGGKNGPQKSGATYSYARRYLTCMIFNINTYDDDDGNGGVASIISKIEYDEITNLLLSLEEAHSPTDMDKFCDHYGIESLEHLPKSRFNQARMALQTKLKRAMAKNGEQNNE